MVQTLYSPLFGFKEPTADLHRKSPRIFLASVAVSAVMVGVFINVPFIGQERHEKKVVVPPVIIRLENIPETRQPVATPAPKLAIPLEISEEFILDDVMIENTEQAVETRDTGPVSAPQKMIEAVTKPAEEEIFEFFAVEEQPEILQSVVPEYPEAAKRVGIAGTVLVKALVGKDGTVEKAEAVRGPKELYEAAVKAARATTFKPAKQNDMPVRCWVQIPFRFTMD